jgi:hypothetical protein
MAPSLEPVGPHQRDSEVDEEPGGDAETEKDVEHEPRSSEAAEDAGGEHQRDEAAGAECEVDEVEHGSLLLPIVGRDGLGARNAAMWKIPCGRKDRVRIGGTGGSQAT